MRNNSWIIISKKTGKPIVELFDKSLVEKINKERYKVETAYDYLCEFNQQTKGAVSCQEKQSTKS